MADTFTAKRKAGLVQAHGSGYGGTGFKFDKHEEGKVKAERKAKAKVRSQITAAHRLRLLYNHRPATSCYRLALPCSALSAWHCSKGNWI